MKNLEGKNIYWFLIDGLSPLYLNICGNKKIPLNFFDNVMSQGVVFSNVAATQGGTHTSMHSIFSSMLPSINGATGWVREALRNFNQEIWTFTDLIKKNGYSTFRYGDADGERCVPFSGFDIWESSGYGIGKCLENGKINHERLNDFIAEIKRCPTPKFVYHHNHLLHELNGKMGNVWSSNQYVRNIAIVAEDFKNLIVDYDLHEDDIIIISSDHGVVLDKDFMKDGIETGEKREEISIRTVFSVIHPTLPKKVFSELVSSLDETPTLLELIFSQKMPGQGLSRVNLIYNNKYEKRICFGEKGTYADITRRSPFVSDIFNLRDDNWKYVVGQSDGRVEWLMNLAENEDYSVNLKNVFPELVDKYYKLLDEQLIHPKKNVFDIYKSNNWEQEKKDLPVLFSLIVHKNLKTAIWDSILDMPGPYYEVIYTGKKKIPWQKNFSNYKIVYCKSKNVKKSARGNYLIFLNPNRPYSEYFLSDLYRFILNNGSDVKKIKLQTGKVIQKISSCDGIKAKVKIREIEKNKNYAINCIVKRIMTSLNNIIKH